MNLKRYILLAAAGLVLVGSFFLPNFVAGVMDTRMLDSLATIDAQSISISTEPVLGLSQRIALAASPNTEMWALTTGQVMEIETAKTRVVHEIARFFRGDSFEFVAGDYDVEDGSAVLVIDSEDTSITLIMWEFKVFDRQKNEMTITIDDETGMILKLIYQQGIAEPLPEESTGEEAFGLVNGDLHDVALRLTEMMTAYYGLTIRLGDYQLGNDLAYYRADIYSGGPVTLMYGVVRVTGFTMNERV